MFSTQNPAVTDPRNNILNCLIKYLDIPTLLAVRRISKRTNQNQLCNAALAKKMDLIKRLSPLAQEAIEEISSHYDDRLKKELISNLAIVLAKVGNFDTAHKIALLLRQGFGFEVLKYLWIDIAREEVKAGKIEIALKGADRFESPKDKCEYLLRVATFQTECNDFKGANETLDRINIPDQPFYLAWLCEARMAAGNFASAFELVHKIVNPNFKFQVYAALGKEKAKRCEHAESEAAFALAMQIAAIDKDHLVINFYKIASTQIDIGYLTQAKKTIEMLEPSYSRDGLYLKLGCAYINIGDHQSAENLVTLISHRPTQETLLQRLSNKTKLLSSAEQDLIRASWQFPSELNETAIREIVKKNHEDGWVPNKYALIKTLVQRCLFSGHTEIAIRGIQTINRPVLRAALLVESIMLVATNERVHLAVNASNFHASQHNL